jgi:hypothetical protein
LGPVALKPVRPKGAKSFLIWAVLASLPQAQEQKKFFGPLFFKKAAAFLFPAKPIAL